MGWEIVALIVTMTVTILGFLWGIINIFKKPHEDKSWEVPLKKFKEEVNNNINDINDKIIKNNNAIHDLKKDTELTAMGIADLKNNMDKVSDKCDKILDKVIEFISKE